MLGYTGDSRVQGCLELRALPLTSLVYLTGLILEQLAESLNIILFGS